MNLEELLNKFPTDEYERKARFYPAILLMTPALLTVFLLVKIETSVLEAAGASFVTLGGAFLLTQLTRDRGKEKEPRLYESWGGVPSATIFRHSDERIDRYTKARYHQRLSELVVGTFAPTIEQENANPSAANQVYTAWSSFLRTNTLGGEFPLVRSELISYGFRRNIYGIRPVGISVSAICFFICIFRFWLVFSQSEQFDSSLILAGAVNLLLTLLWLFQFKSHWVRVPAFAYASRLAESIEILSTTPSKETEVDKP